MVRCWAVQREGSARSLSASELLRPGSTLADAEAQFSVRHMYFGFGDGVVTRQHLERYEVWLRERRGKKVEIAVAQRGQRADLMRTATRNAQQALIRHKTRRTSDYVARTQALTDLQDALGLTEFEPAPE